MPCHKYQRTKHADVAFDVLTTVPILRLITSFTDHGPQEDAMYDYQVLASLYHRHVANGYLGTLGDTEEDISEEDVSEEDVVAQAKASDVDANALYRALKIRKRIGEWVGVTLQRKLWNEYMLEPLIYN
ncbi:Aste57867_7031 [Aphanomyces stellatus]|uniref:Aste57867_1806 protein n=1 Tax=Aphanomyces stellatus TaxID=120398 RepID=A0A485KAC5_9STRA|nr:hypothetical protein As57867_007008 [Aphanomyces stellatus]KAF0718237.1 hypothetical protein As57867_001804 [Aphanomyces stellatus]VFT79015.1 Aste57867_1806 [Aphanomyces stellatus]VFT83979.1 Aste57867_7031 [Aphanomyces stellatus]